MHVQSCASDVVLCTIVVVLYPAGRRGQIALATKHVPALREGEGRETGNDLNCWDRGDGEGQKGARIGTVQTYRCKRSFVTRLRSSPL